MPYVAVHLAAQEGVYSDAEYQQAVAAVKSRLHTQAIPYETVEYSAKSGEIVVVLPANAATVEQIESLTAHIEIGFWTVRPRTAPDMMALLNRLSSEERMSWPWSKLIFMEDEHDPRIDVLALSREEAILDTIVNLLEEKLPNDRRALWLAEAGPYYAGPEVYQQLFILETEGQHRAPVNQVHIESAEMLIDENSAAVMLQIVFDEEGTRLWEQMTERAANNNNGNVAITIGDQVLSAPRVREPIRAGRSVITGAFSAKEADEMAQILNSGSLPMPLTVISTEQRKE